MSDLATTELGKRAWTPRWVWLLLGLVAALFVAANAHLVYVATVSQPACVEHLGQGQVRDQVRGKMQDQGSAGPSRFAAAQSSCSSVPAKPTASP
jgi:hypothetical protein